MVGKPLFRLAAKSYLITSHWAEALLSTAEDLEPHTRNKARFYLTQIINAFAPSNGVFTNPELLHETFASDGENLVRGMQLLAEDIERGSGRLKSGRPTRPSSRSARTWQSPRAG